MKTRRTSKIGRFFTLPAWVAAGLLAWGTCPARAQFATGFEASQSSGTPAYVNGGTVIGVQDIQAPAGHPWTTLFGSSTGMTATSTSPKSGALALQISDASTTSAYGAYVDLDGTTGMDLSRPFTVTFSMNLANVSAATNNQVQVYLGAANTNMASTKYWMAFYYNNGNLFLYTSNAAGNNSIPVPVGSYASFASGTGYVKVNVTIDPVLKKYTRVLVSGPLGSDDYTADVLASAGGGTIPWLPASSATLPETKLVFVTGTDDTVTAKFDDIQVTPATQWFEAFAPGVLLPDQGTIELTAALTRPISQFGNSTGYDFLFKAQPAQAIPAGKTLMGLFVPSAGGGTGLMGLARNGTSSTSSVYSNYAAFSPAVGSATRVAMTWGSTVKLFVNGVQQSSAASTIGDLGPIPALFRIERLDPFNISEVKVSDVALTTVSGNAAVPLASDTHTTMLVSNGLTRTQYFHSTRLASLGYASLTPRWRPEDQSVTEGKTPVYNVVGINHSGAAKTYSVHLTAVDHTGATVLNITPTVTVAGDNAYHVTGLPLTGLTARGHYSLHADITAPGGAVTSYDNTVALFPANDTATTDGAFDHYLGYQYPLEDHSPAVLNTMGIKTNRVFGDLSGFYWFSLAPSSGTGAAGYTWARTDELVGAATAAGIDLLAELGNPPPWAATDPGATYKGSYLPYSKFSGRWKPASTTAWGNYVYQTVNRYQDVVKNWEIWNEVDWHPPGQGYSFSGTTAEYLTLLQTAFAQAKAADPSSNVLMSGFGLISGGCDTSMPTTLLSTGAATAFDTFASHGYENGKVDALNTALYAAKGAGSPHWMTEQMWDSVSYEQDRLFLTPYLYLRYIDQGIGRFYQFGFDGLGFDSFTQGPLIDGYVQGVFQSQLRKAQTYVGKYAAPAVANFGIRHYFTRTDGKTLSILGQELTYNRVTVAGTVVSAIDTYGHAVPSAASGSGTALDITDVAYIVSAAPLNITNVQVIQAAPLLLNTDFEAITGDLGTGGLASCSPMYWTLRTTTYDPSGAIVLTNSSVHSGSYAMQITTSGAGRVYVFQNATISQGGSYQVTAWFRRPNAGETAIPYLSIYNQDTGVITTQTYPGIVSGGSGYAQVTFTFTLPGAMTHPLSVIAGAYTGTGTVLVDDVVLTRTGP